MFNKQIEEYIESLREIFNSMRESFIEEFTKFCNDIYDIERKTDD